MRDGDAFRAYVEQVLVADLTPGDVVVTIESISPEEIAADEERWSKSFAASQDALSRMADQALKDLDEGRTDELDPDNL